MDDGEALKLHFCETCLLGPTLPDHVCEGRCIRFGDGETDCQKDCECGGPHREEQ